MKDHLTLRPVSRKDCRSLWLWRNHPQARKWSFNAGVIAYKDHLRWFTKKLKDPATTIYVAWRTKTSRIGQVRFDRQGQRAVVSVTVNPRYYGKGWGNLLIKEISGRYFQEKPRIKMILAEIIWDHLASQKAFHKAGYRIWEKTTKAVKKIYVMKFQRPRSGLSGEMNDH